MKKEPGTYALLLRASSSQSIAVGALGEMAVRPGWYVYVGSAFGAGGLQARVDRHVRGDGALHWHVDYLRAVTRLEAVWYTHDDSRRECGWSTCLRDMTGARVLMSGFGASDCDCPTHLLAFGAPPAFRAFCAALRARVPDHASVHERHARVLHAN